jgi:hypothetical protein
MWVFPTGIFNWRISPSFSDLINMLVYSFVQEDGVLLIYYASKESISQICEHGWRVQDVEIADL